MAKTADIIVLGGGLAGLSLAKELIDRNLKVCLIDPKGISSGASGHPIGLANYATGRYAKLSWEAENCLQSLIKNLDEVQNRSPVRFWKQNGVLRPALDEDIATKTRENFLETEWPDSATAEWLDASSLKELNPHIPSEFGGLWANKGCTVITPLYLQSLRDLLLSKGLVLIEKEYELHRNDAVHLKTHSGDEIQSALIADCTGHQELPGDIKPKLKLHPVKGELLLFRRNEAIPFEHSLSALGYIGQMDQKYFAVGSTYEHHFEDEKTTEKGREKLIAKMKRVVPMLLEGAEIVEHWSGVRASTPNRLPIAGKHPVYDKYFALKGLGSKGLLYSAHASKLLADHITDSLPLPREIDIQRFF
jgi:glycine/D-amino acid oxidase-like deaminating enzyme